MRICLQCKCLSHARFTALPINVDVSYKLSNSACKECIERLGPWSSYCQKITDGNAYISALATYVNKHTTWVPMPCLYYQYSSTGNTDPEGWNPTEYLFREKALSLWNLRSQFKSHFDKCLLPFKGCGILDLYHQDRLYILIPGKFMKIIWGIHLLSPVCNKESDRAWGKQSNCWIERNSTHCNWDVFGEGQLQAMGQTKSNKQASPPTQVVSVSFKEFQEISMVKVGEGSTSHILQYSTTAFYNSWISIWK